MANIPHLFGGDWTAEKLERVRQYLSAYATILQNKRYRFAYIDAFAGTGYRAHAKPRDPAGGIFPELAEEETQEFLDGSARIALKVVPRFHRYIFIEKSLRRYKQLEKLKDEFPALAEDIILVKADANVYLQDLCLNKNWKERRAVLFLDPYGMQVSWDTIKAIASTKAIDLWILFPLGVAVNRMVTKDGRIIDAWRRKLDMMFGEPNWYEAFYQSKVTEDLFGPKVSVEKAVDFQAIGQYFVTRLETIFAGVAQTPRPLFNSRNNPLYLLCFASANPKGSKTAIKIADWILKKD